MESSIEEESSDASPPKAVFTLPFDSSESIGRHSILKPWRTAILPQLCLAKDPKQAYS